MERRIKRVHLQSNVIIIGIAIIFALLCYIIFSSERKPSIDLNSKSNFETSRDALERQNTALKKLSEEQQRTTEYFSQRDSSLQIELKLNRKAIEKIKIPNEIYKRFNSYGSNDWSGYFANLPDPGQ